MRTLQARLPAFMTSDVIAEFRRGLKLLAIFPRKQTRESLAILQYALTAYLSQIRYQELKEFDAEIAHLRSYLTDLQRAREQTSDLLRVLQVSQDCAAPVPLKRSRFSLGSLTLATNIADARMPDLTVRAARPAPCTSKTQTSARSCSQNFPLVWRSF